MSILNPAKDVAEVLEPALVRLTDHLSRELDRVLDEALDRLNGATISITINLPPAPSASASSPPQARSAEPPR